MTTNGVWGGADVVEAPGQSGDRCDLALYFFDRYRRSRSDCFMLILTYDV